MDSPDDDVSSAKKTPLTNMKRDLYFSKPLMNAAGSLGFAPNLPGLKDLGDLELGAL